MVVEKNVKQGDVYLSTHELAKMFDVTSHDIYVLRNKGKLRYTFNPASGQISNIIHFNLDDVRRHI